ncbi:MAG: hypothetical protein KBC81_03650 [Candidatus Pacebacteria bacterium]|nr:hypothetical protein [Candidatus Paceibacterota bacterium]
MGFPVWKTVVLGLVKSQKNYRMALRKAGYEISGWGEKVLKRTTVSPVELELDLVAVTVEELGLEIGAHRDVACAKALELGLQLCPAEVGPALRLLYRDQPRGELLRIGMRAVAYSAGRKLTFGLNHSDFRGQELNGFGGQALDGYIVAARVVSRICWVFVRPRK